jgi:hypothetical protein
MKKNNRKNCGRKAMDWIDKKSQIQITIPNKMINELTNLQGDAAKKATTKLMHSNIAKVIDLIAN